MTLRDTPTQLCTSQSIRIGTCWPHRWATDAEAACWKPTTRDLLRKRRQSGFGPFSQKKPLHGLRPWLQSKVELFRPYSHYAAQGRRRLRRLATRRKRRAIRFRACDGPRKFQSARQKGALPFLPAAGARAPTPRGDVASASARSAVTPIAAHRRYAPPRTRLRAGRVGSI